MANRKLNSIKFPDIADTYILDADKVNFDDSETYASGSVGKALQHKAEVDGSYDSMTVGNAEQLVSNVRVNDKTPYLFRTSGGSVDIGDREYVNGITGVSLPWNQWCTNGNFEYRSGNYDWYSSAGTVVVSDNIGKFTANAQNANMAIATAITNGHKYFVQASIKASSTSVLLSFWTSSKAVPSTGSFVDVALIANVNYDGASISYPRITDTRSSDFDEIQVKNVIVIDLTQLFGSTIADYIYSLEQATAGAGVAWFRKLFNKPYYAYNAGELKSVSGLVSHDMTGFNQWDEEWELGYYDNSTGDKSTGSSTIRCKNYIPVIPSTTYFFKSPSGVFVYFYDANKRFVGVHGGGTRVVNNTIALGADVHFIRFSVVSEYGTTYNNDICINISWDGSRDGEYEPYELHSYPLDSDLTLRGIPKLDANNSLYYDGDIYEPDGTVTRKYGVITIDGSSSLTYQYNGDTADGAVECYIALSSKAFGIVNFVTNKFAFVQASSAPFTAAGRTNNNGIAFRLPSTVTKSNAGCKAWFESNPTTVIYELATPTTETADAYVGTQIVNDFGTEEYVISNGTFAVPVGHDTDYPINLVAKLEMAPNSPEGNGDYIVRQTNGMNEYVPLVIEDALPTIPSTAGTYKLTVTVASGSDPVLSWEAE